MRNLVWLASYPKSGNTWLRSFLVSLTNPKTINLDINELDSIPIPANPNFLERELGFDCDLLTQAEVENLLPQALESSSERERNSLKFFKVHNALSCNASGALLFPENLTKIAVYLIRNPLDIAVSWSFFAGDSNFDAAIKQLCQPQTTISWHERSFPKQFPQRLMDWSEHVNSWTLNPRMPAIAVRYEDMVSNPKTTFSKIIASIGLPYDNDEVAHAIETTRFETLQKQERANGFQEKPPHAKTFFRSGTPGAWKSHLSQRQIDTVIRKHHDVMQRYRYLDTIELPTP